MSDVEVPDGIRGELRPDDTNGDGGNEEAQWDADEREHDRLGEQLQHDTPASGP